MAIKRGNSITWSILLGVVLGVVISKAMDHWPTPVIADGQDGKKMVSEQALMFRNASKKIAPSVVAITRKQHVRRAEGGGLAFDRNGSDLAGKFFYSVILALVLMGGFATQAAAQGVVKGKFGDWEMRCETPPGAARDQCALMQSVAAEDKPNVNLVVIVLKTADGKSRLLRVIAPLGVLLPSGLGLKLDNVDVGRAGFVRCLPNGCVAEVVMDDKLLGQLRTAKTATFIIFETPEEGIGFPLSLNGIGEGYDKLP